MSRSLPEAIQWQRMPLSGTAGSIISGIGSQPVSIRVVSAQGNPIPSYGQSVYLMLNYSSNALGSNITLSGAGPSTPDPTTGIATFSSLTITPAGTYNLVAYVQSTSDILNFLSVPSDPFVLS